MLCYAMLLVPNSFHVHIPQQSLAGRASILLPRERSAPAGNFLYIVIERWQPIFAKFPFQKLEFIERKDSKWISCNCTDSSQQLAKWLNLLCERNCSLEDPFWTEITAWASFLNGKYCLSFLLERILLLELPSWTEIISRDSRLNGNIFEQKILCNTNLGRWVGLTRFWRKLIPCWLLIFLYLHEFKFAKCGQSGQTSRHYRKCCRPLFFFLMYIFCVNKFHGLYPEYNIIQHHSVTVRKKNLLFFGVLSACPKYMYQLVLLPPHSLSRSVVDSISTT